MVNTIIVVVIAIAIASVWQSSTNQQPVVEVRIARVSAAH